MCKSRGDARYKDTQRTWELHSQSSGEENGYTWTSIMVRTKDQWGMGAPETLCWTVRVIPCSLSEQSFEGRARQTAGIYWMEKKPACVTCHSCQGKDSRVQTDSGFGRLVYRQLEGNKAGITGIGGTRGLWTPWDRLSRSSRKAWRVSEPKERWEPRPRQCQGRTSMSTTTHKDKRYGAQLSPALTQLLYPGGSSVKTTGGNDFQLASKSWK